MGVAAGLAGESRREVVIAAASNLSDVFREIGSQFEAETHIHPVFSFASTSVLAQQAIRGAPFDLIALADETHLEELEGKSLLVPGSRAVYAFGSLALWVPQGAAGIQRIEDLTTPSIKVIAIAKPELAPYGAAAVAALKHAGIWDLVRRKIVYAESVTMAKRLGTTGNADAVLTAYPLVLREKGTVVLLEPHNHPPIGQALGILATAASRADAARFSQYILTGPGKVIFQKYGYQVPRR